MKKVTQILGDLLNILLCCANKTLNKIKILIPVYIITNK